MILLNAIYFKSIWLKEFPENATLTYNFYNFNDESKVTKRDFMSIREHFNYYEDKEMQSIELSYTKDAMAAIIILPKQDITINDFISNLNDEKLQKIIKRMNNEEVELKLPKFEIEFSSLLNDALQKMGMVDAFEPEKADLTGMKDKGDIYIGKVLQKSYLKVDEKGTEAASITSVDIQFWSLPKYYNMIVNKPFLFILRNKKLPQYYDIIFMAKIEEL